MLVKYDNLARRKGLPRSNPVVGMGLNHQSYDFSGGVWILRAFFATAPCGTSPNSKLFMILFSSCRDH